MRKLYSFISKLFQNLVRIYLFIFNILPYIFCSSFLNLLLYSSITLFSHVCFIFVVHYGVLRDHSLFLNYFMYSLFLHLAITAIINFKLHYITFTLNSCYLMYMSLIFCPRFPCILGLQHTEVFKKCFMWLQMMINVMNCKSSLSDCGSPVYFPLQVHLEKNRNAHTNL